MNTEESTFYKGAIGSDDFKELIESGDYVDKSLFIKDIIHDKHKVLLITRPRRWGKSSNMSLLKTFLELEVDKEGNPLPKEKRVNPVYFTGGIIEEDGIKQTLPPLKIINKAYYSAEKDYEKYRITMYKLGKYPVIMLNFKDLSASSHENLVEDFKVKMSTTFNRYHYLLNSPHLNAIEKTQITAYLSKTVSELEVQNSIRFLMECLYKHFNQKIWVLIDEYDSAIHRAYIKFGKDKENPYQFSPEFQKVLDLFRDFMGPALKSETHLEKGVVTGILRIAKANLFSTLNNFTEYNILDEDFAPYYGFTPDEVDMLCNEQNIEPEKRLEIKQWYNGYSYGGLELYNPWSIVRCLFSEDHEIKNYWEESGGFGFLTNIMIDDAVQKEIQTFMRAPCYQEDVYVNNYIDLGALLQADTQTVVSLLLHSGYLNPINSQRIGDHKVYTLGLPNREIVAAFDSLIKKWVSKKLGVQESRFNNIEIALYKGDVELFKERLADFLSSATSFNTIKHGDVKLKESHYHFLMKAILYGMHITKEVVQEKESGNGRVDTVIVPKLYQGDQAIVLEYKYAKTKESLRAESAAALQQIKDKNYIATIVGEKHIKSVLQLGIAFHQKEVEVLHEIKYLHH